MGSITLNREKLLTLLKCDEITLKDKKLIDLENQNIGEIDVNTFNGLGNLKSLSLDSNNISNINPGTFNGLDNLKSLSLKSNNISNIKPDTFKGLSSLNRLNLSYNRITYIESGAFNELNNLEKLILYGNDILLHSQNFSKIKTKEKNNNTISRNKIKVINNNISKIAIFKGLPKNTEIQVYDGD